MRTSLLIAMVVLPVVTITALVVYLLRVQINDSLKSPIADNILLVIFNSGGRLRRGLGAFFIYKSEKKDRIHEKRQEEIKQDHDTRQQQIRIHCNTIVSEYNQHRFKARPLRNGSSTIYFFRVCLR